MFVVGLKAHFSRALLERCIGGALSRARYTCTVAASHWPDEDFVYTNLLPFIIV